MKKKILSIILCMAMVIAMTPSMVFATYTETIIGNKNLIVGEVNGVSTMTFSEVQNWLKDNESNTNPVKVTISKEITSGFFADGQTNRVLLFTNPESTLEIEKGCSLSLYDNLYFVKLLLKYPGGIVYVVDDDRVTEVETDLGQYGLNSSNCDVVGLSEGEKKINDLIEKRENNGTKAVGVEFRLDADNCIYTFNLKFSNAESGCEDTEKNVVVKVKRNTAMGDFYEDFAKDYVLGGELSENCTKDSNGVRNLTGDCKILKTPDRKITVNLNGKNLYIAPGVEKVVVEGAQALIEGPTAVMLDDDDYATPGLYMGKIDQNFIDGLKDNYKITLKADYNIAASDVPLYVTNNTVTLEKGVFQSAAVHYAVAEYNGDDERSHGYYESLEAALQAASEVQSKIYVKRKSVEFDENTGRPIISTAKIEGIGLYKVNPSGVCSNEADCDKAEITLLRDTKEGNVVKVNSGSIVVLDLNNHKIDNSIQSEGVLFVVNRAASNAKTKVNNRDKQGTIGTGEITGELIYDDASHINLIHGIFDLAGVKDEDTGLLENVEDKIVDENSMGYEISNQWIVLETALDAISLDYQLHYAVFPATVSDKAINAAFADADWKEEIAKLDAISYDADDIEDLAANVDYKAVIYLEGAAGVKVRTFDFKANYDPSIMVGNKVDSTAHVLLNKFGGKTEGENSAAEGTDYIEYYLASGTVTPGEDSGVVPVAVIDFKIDPKSENVYADAPVNLTFTKDDKGNDYYVGTMATIHKIPLKYNDYLGSIRNAKDGVVFLDYAYAPDGYKLAVIADEHNDYQTLTLKDTDVYYTTNPYYVAHSTNPTGEYIDAAKHDEAFGVYLAFVEESVATEQSMANPYDKTVYKSMVGLKGTKKNPAENVVIGSCEYDNVNLDGEFDSNGKATQVNDASVAYQMLRHFATNGKEGSAWGYDPADTGLYIDTLQRLAAENNRDGRLYGTIEDINSILNIALGTPGYY